MIDRLSSRILWIGLCLEGLVLFIAALESTGETAAFYQSAARLSGRVSLFFFVLLLVYATNNPDIDRNRASFQVKYRLFRDFAVIHVIHWFLLAASVWLNHFELVPSRVAGGLLAYLLVVAMPLFIRNQWFSDKVLRYLQGFFLFWVWFIFFMTYITRLRGQSPDASGTPSAWWPLLIITTGLMVWRIWQLWKRSVNTVIDQK